ncbi:MAG: Cdc6/Cdc18 family protein [Candidatus Hodarchaeota archaeon]
MDFEEELKKAVLEGKIFKRNGKETFKRNFIPEKVPHRDEILKKLILEFKIILNEYIGISVAIKGAGGYGKTLVSRFSQEKLSKVAAELGVNIDTRYYTCFQYRTLGTILRDYMPQELYISGKGFSVSELLSFLVSNLRREDKKLLLIIDEVQNLSTDDILRILSINEDTKTPESVREYISTILIARDYDWDIILQKEPRIAQRLNATIELPKYTIEQLADIYQFRRDLAFLPGVLSDENVDFIADTSKLTGNVYYGLEVMYHAGKIAEEKGSQEILPEMIRTAEKMVSTEFRDPVLVDLQKHELLSLLAIARMLEKNSKENINNTTTKEAFAEYQLVCEELYENKVKPHVISVFRKHVKKLDQSKLIKETVINIETRGRRADITILGFPAELVHEKVLEILNKKD